MAKDWTNFTPESVTVGTEYVDGQRKWVASAREYTDVVGVAMTPEEAKMNLIFALIADAMIGLQQ